MDQMPLKVIALGLSEPIGDLLECAWQKDAFEIAAVADPDVERAAAAARRYECQTFDDVRQLIVQSQGDVFFVGSPAHLSAEPIQLALEKQYHLFKTAPAGMNFEQAAQWIRDSARQQRRYITVQPGRFHPLVDHLRDILDRSEVNFWHLITGVCHIPQPPTEPDQRWLYDPSLAGGGVLLRNAYGLIDELILCFGLPQQVYSQMSNQAPDRLHQGHSEPYEGPAAADEYDGGHGRGGDAVFGYFDCPDFGQPDAGPAPHAPADPRQGPVCHADAGSPDGLFA